MKLEVGEKNLQVKLNPLEKLFSLRGDLKLPLEKVVGASAERPSWNLGQIRAPGTHLPFILKAGTYHDGKGREFWFATAFKSFLTINLRDWDYDRVIVTMGGNDTWARRINGVVEGKAA